MLGLDRTLASPDRLRVDILPSDTPPFVNSLDKVSAWLGAPRAVVQGGISHDFGNQTSMAHVTWRRGTAKAKGVIDAAGILNRARPWVHQQAHEIQPFGHLVK